MKNGKNNICEELILRDYLAADRTILANERTLLAYIRTALTLFVSGISFFYLVQLITLRIVGSIFIICGLVFFIVGIIRYQKMKRPISQIKSNGDKMYVYM